MSVVAVRVWGWIRPVLSYRPWGSKPAKDKEQQMGSSWGGVGSWLWPGRKTEVEQGEPPTELWEEAMSVQPMQVEELLAERLEVERRVCSAPRWWRRMLPWTWFSWSRVAGPGGLEAQSRVGWSWAGREPEQDGAESDYETPPPSPTPPSQVTSPLRYFAHSWTVDVLPEHYEICFNFLRHLFDLFVVGFLWTVSPPVRVVLDILGIQGALKLWIHGMAMFLVSTVGMAGLLWLIQEYLPQFALIYGILQVLVISVSVHQSVVLGEDEKKEDNKEPREEELELQAEPVPTRAEHNKRRGVS